MRLPIITIWTLHITNKTYQYEYITHFLSIKRARKYFEAMNGNKEFEVSLEKGILQLW